MKKLISVFIISLFTSVFVFPQTWTVQNSGTTSTLWGVWFMSANTGVVTGTSGKIIKTTNGGVNWVNKSSGTTKDLMFLQFVNTNTGFAGGLDGPMLKTTNAGESWQVIAFSNIGTNKCGGLWCFNETTIVCGFGTSSYANSKILRTTNGGTSWDTVYNPGAGSGWISYFHFPNSNTGYCTVSGGKVYKTVNGGLNWTSISVVSGNYWTSGVYFFDGNTGFVGGGVYNSTVLGSILKTTNGGANWNTVSNTGISTISFVDANNGYALAANDTAGFGTLLKTVNGGTNWTAFTAPEDSLNNFQFQNSSLGYAVGVRGTIIRWGNPIGIQTISNEVPSKFSLSQNYPNPFNPSTKIRYELQKSGFVKLVVFDALGRVVETLVNEKQSPGTYETEFNGSNHPSGVYIYKIISGNFTESRKMLLVN